MNIKNIRRARREAMKDKRVALPSNRMFKDKSKYSRKNKHRYGED